MGAAECDRHGGFDACTDPPARLARYLEAPYLSIDNNAVENALAAGRRWAGGTGCTGERPRGPDGSGADEPDAVVPAAGQRAVRLPAGRAGPGRAPTRPDTSTTYCQIAGMLPVPAAGRRHSEPGGRTWVRSDGTAAGGAPVTT